MDDAKPVYVYVVDTSVWFTLRGIMAVPGMWLWLERLVTEGRIVIPREVVNEVGLHGDKLDKWVHDQHGAHRATEDVWELACDIADEFPDLVDTRKKDFDADAYLVATAIAEQTSRATGMFPCEVIVVTGERAKLPGKVAIPDACAKRGIRSITLTEWFEMEGVSVGPPNP